MKRVCGRDCSFHGSLEVGAEYCLEPSLRSTLNHFLGLSESSLGKVYVIPARRTLCLVIRGGSVRLKPDGNHGYLANSIARVSRMTFTLMVPGYCMDDSILVAMSRANLMALRS